MAIVPEMAADYVRSYWNPFESGEFSSQRKGWAKGAQQKMILILEEWTGMHRGRH